MADAAPVPPPRAGRLNTLLLLVLTLCAVVLAADRVEQWYLRWQYSRAVSAYRDARAFNDGPTAEQKEAARQKYDAIWKAHRDAFRSLGLRDPDEWFRQ